MPCDNDHLAAKEWHQKRDKCRVRRFWAGTEEHGYLVYGWAALGPLITILEPRRS